MIFLVIFVHVFVRSGQPARKIYDLTVGLTPIEVRGYDGAKSFAGFGICTGQPLDFRAKIDGRQAPAP